MAIAEQFAGLNMEQLIGGPLSAAADASAQLANSTAEFINRVGFDAEGKVRTVAFGYEKRSVNEDGTSNLDEMKVAVPMLAIVPIPNLQVDEVNILFDMEVKQSERQESSKDLSGSMSGSLNMGIVKVSVTGSVSAHQSNTRSTDNSAKYHVDVRATNHGTPEGLARVLDMMAANVAPVLVGSTIKDGNGQSLPEKARIKAENLKVLRNDISQIEIQLTRAQDGYTSGVAQLKRLASTQLNIYRDKLNRLTNAADTAQYDEQIKAAKANGETERVTSLTKQKEEADKVRQEYANNMEVVNQSFNSFLNQADDYIKILADSQNKPDGVSEMFALNALDDQGKVIAYQEGESQYASIKQAQDAAIDSQMNVKRLENDLFQKKTEYNDAMAGKEPSLPQK